MSSISGVSPFPPIAEYAFLSNCHTGALVAPDGSVDWLCVPSFDSPSVFGSLLDRGSGYFRFGPYGINVPTSRTYVPGTNVNRTGIGGGSEPARGWSRVSTEEVSRRAP
jgi:GH15 family glucan-1,4-alpha-glucosidase